MRPLQGLPLASGLLGLALLLVPTPASVAAPRLEAAAALEKSEAAIGRAVGGHLLTGADGLPLRMDIFQGKPLVVSLVYTACSAICPATTQQLKSAVARARKIQRFLSQPFNVAEVFTGTPGKIVPLAETIKGFKMIVNGELDELPEQAFYMRGPIEEAIEAGEKMMQTA